MKINIRIIKRGTFDITLSMPLEQLALPRSCRNEAIEWEVSYKSSDILVDDLMSFADAPNALLINGQDKALIQRMRILEREVQAFVRNNRKLPLVKPLVIAVFPSPMSPVEITEFPDLVADWVCAPVAMPDIAYRVLFALKRHGMFKRHIGFAGVTLIAETRQAIYEDRSIQLSSAEFALLGLFLERMSTIVPFNDLVLFFKSSGKSAEPNNIRVAVFQIRLKLESLTRSHITLVNIYRQGYCVRKKNATAFPLTSPPLSQNQLTRMLANSID